MSIRLKFLLLSVLGVLSALLILQYVLVQYVVYPRLALTEVGLAEWGTRRVAELVKVELRRVERLTSYLAAEPTVVEYLAVRGDAPWPVQLAADRLQVDHINLVYVCDASGRVLGRRWIDDEGAELAIPSVLPEDALPFDHPLLTNPDGTGEAGGLLPTAWGLMLVASRRIGLADRPAAAPGTLIVGRWVAEAEIFELIEKARKPSLLMPRINAKFLIGGAGANGGAAGKAGGFTSDARERIKHEYVDLDDINGNPILRLYADLEHPKHSEAGRIVSATRAAASVAALLFLMLGTFGLDRLFVRRVRLLSDDVRRLRTAGDGAGRVKKRGGDEIGQLAVEMNRLYAGLERQTRDLQASAESLRENQQHLASAEAIAHIGHFAWDIAAGTLYHSQEFHSVFGTTDEGLASAGVSALAQCVHPDDRETVVNEMMRSARAGGATSFEFRTVRKRGDTRDVRAWIEVQCDEAGHPARIVGMVQDTTERMAARAERTLLATAIDQAAESIIVTDIDHTILYVNPAFTHITGFTSKEAVGRTPRILQCGAQGAGFYREMHQLLARGETWSGHFTNRRKDGSTWEGDATIAPVRDPAGRVIRYVNVTRDTSDVFRLETQLRQRHKMEAIGTLAGGIAHDFNNILTGVTGYAELARANMEDQSKTAGWLDEVLRGAERARDLVSRILLFSRQSPANACCIAVNPIVDEVASLLRAALPSSIELRHAVPAKPLCIEADPTSIHQVLMNLCTNASHAMDERGVLQLTLEEVELDAAFCRDRPNLTPGTYARIVVRDDGCGMDSQTLDRIFDPYFTTKDCGKGTGLGLAVVHGIVADHGGDIQVSSELGLGTTFCVYFPAATAVPSQEDVPESWAPRGAGARILLVDDEEVIRSLVDTALGGLGYRVEVCANGAAVLDRMADEPNRYDLILTDMTMPGMTGLELAQRLHSLCPDTPILLWTGMPTAVDAEAARRAGIIEILGKPLRIQELAEAVRRVLDSVKPASNAMALSPFAWRETDHQFN